MDAAGLLKPSHPHLIVAVSGGADSTALLIGLASLAAAERPAQSITACYIDHGLRPPAERDAEQQLVRQLCLGLSLPLQVITVDVTFEQRRLRLSWEDAARRCRYAALGDFAVRIGAGAVITGHTRDDQVETVLMRILRGTGLRGLRGMDVRSKPWGAAGPLLLRPMLNVTRAETEAYCAEAGAAWSVDSTNASDRFVRNRVRYDLLPGLAAEYPSVTPALLRLAQQAGDFTVWLDGEVSAVMDRLWSDSGDAATLATPPAEMPAFMRGQAVAAALTRLLRAPGPPSSRLVDAVADLWKGRCGRQLQIGGGWQVKATAAGLQFRSARSIARRELEHTWTELNVQLGPGRTDFDGWEVTVCPAEGHGYPGKETDDSRHVAYLPIEPVETGHRLSVRYWTPGARLQPVGMNHEKKLQDIFVDEKVPRRVRHSTPLLYLDDQCVWVVGVKRSPIAGPLPGPAKALRVVFEPVLPTDRAASNGL